MEPHRLDPRRAPVGARISDDSGAFCNGGDREEITSAQLITAREIRRELDGDPKDDDHPEHKVGLASKHITLPPGAIHDAELPRPQREGRGRLQRHVSPRPQTFYRLAKLTRDVARGLLRPAALRRTDHQRADGTAKDIIIECQGLGPGTLAR